MRCGFSTVFIVCHVNLFVLFGVSANDANADNGAGNINIDASAAATATDASASLPPDENLNFDKLPTILIVTLFRNKAHTMPYFFTFLNRIDYPKERISLWLRSDHNSDKTIDVLYQWLYTSARAYHNVDIEYDNTTQQRESETSQTHWSNERYLEVIRMKEEALNYGRKIWADYILFLDADVFLTRPTILKELVSTNAPIISPMLISDGLYSNFWGGMTSEYYYQRTDQYKKIYSYEEQGRFAVPMVHSAVLIHLNDERSDTLTFNRTALGERFSIAPSDLELIPIDDIIIFALSANYSQLPLQITNEYLYGYVTVPLEAGEDFAKEYAQMVNVKIMILNDEHSGGGSIAVDPVYERFVTYADADAMSFDRIFMINLLRRPERRTKMEQSFKEIGLQVEHMAAIDGNALTPEYLDEIGVKFLPGYSDPFQHRPMTKGEIGCFLSHFMIWEKQVLENLNEVLVLEDDIRFEPYFKQRAMNVMQEARQIDGWDLIYFGRKRLLKKNEKWVGDSNQLVHASYSYWTLGYALSLRGAKKLLAARPLDNLIPVDEFLPVMFDQHQNETWKKAFANRNLVAWSAAPLLLFPTHYTGDDGYFSDTEQSDTINVFAENGTIDKKGNKENYNDIATEQSAPLDGDHLDQNPNTNASNNASIDTSFLINGVNDHAAIQHPSADQHTEL